MESHHHRLVASRIHASKSLERQPLFIGSSSPTCPNTRSMADSSLHPNRLQDQLSRLTSSTSSPDDASTHSSMEEPPSNRKLGSETQSDPSSSIPQNQDVEYVVERIRVILQYDKAHTSTEWHGSNPIATPKSSLERAIGLFQRVVAHFVQFLYRAINYRNVVAPNPTSITHPSHEHADNHALRELCSKLLEYAGCVESVAFRDRRP